MLQPKLTRVVPESPCTLRLFYETGEVKLFDVAPYISGYGMVNLRMSCILGRCVCFQAVSA